MQCYAETNSTDPNEVYWYETTDFYYVREVDFWQSLDDGKFDLRSVLQKTESIKGKDVKEEGIR